MIGLKPQKGHLLVAEPSIIGDVSFNRAVVLLADHSPMERVFNLREDISFSWPRLPPEIVLIEKGEGL